MGRWNDAATELACCQQKMSSHFPTKGENESRCAGSDGLVLLKRRRSTKRVICCGAAGTGRSDGIKERRWV